MNRFAIALSVLAATAVELDARQAVTAAPLQLATPFERTAEVEGVVTLTFDGGDYAILSQVHGTEPVRLARFPLPGREPVDLILQPTSAFEDGGKAVVVEADGSMRLVAPQVKCFFGFVEGGGTAFLAISPTTLQGYMSAGEEAYFLSSDGDARTDRATVAHSSKVTPGDVSLQNFCDTTPLEDPEGKFGRAALEEHGRIGLGSGSSIETARLWIEADHQLRNQFGSDQACIDYVTLLTSFSSSIYRRDTGMRLTIPDGFLRVWNTTPPWGVVNDFGGLNPFASWWSGNHPNSNANRTLVHLLTRPAFGGVAYLDVACSHSAGYALSSVNGSFPNPIQHTSPSNWDLVVYSHELGHNFASPHTFNYNPPIECDDGSGPDNGTIMSYCHQNPGGTNNIGLRFHRRVQSLLRANIATEGCISSQNIQAGDYDGDGAVDFGDVFTANAIFDQGFDSIAAEEAFDMDGDGDFDQFDLDLLNASIGAAPASAVITNGSNANEVCYLPMNQPIIGEVWDSQVLAFPAGTFTVILGYSGGTSGIFFSLGELLIDPVSAFLFANVSASDFLFAVHSIPVPYDPALIGASATVQGFTATKACNALELVVSYFE